MSRLQGRVLAVESLPQGSSAVDWTGTTLQVVDGSDFVREGGQFAVDGVVYDYAAVVEGENDGDPDVVTTVQSSPGGFVGEFRVDIYPPAVDVVAEVELVGGSGSIPAAVPTELQPLLPAGVRDAATGEAVELVQVGQRWQVAEVVGRDYGESAAATTSLGSVVVDDLSILDADDNPVASLTPDGALSLAGDVVSGGTSLASVVAGLPRFIGVFSAPNCSATPAGSSETGQFDISFYIVPGHLHRVTFDGFVDVPANTRFQLNLRAVSGASGSEASTPTVANGVLWASGIYSSGATGGVQRVALDHFFATSYSEPTEYRVLVTLQNLTADAPVAIANSNLAGIRVQTLGADFPGSLAGEVNANTGGVTPYGGSGATTPPSTVKKTYTTTWRASAVKSWKPSWSGTSPLYAGSLSGSDQRSSWVLFGTGATSSTAPGEVGKSLAAALTGSTGVTLKLKMFCQHTYASSGASLRLSWHNTTSTPSSQVSAGSYLTVVSIREGEVEIPASSTVIADLAAGTVKGVVLGDTSGQSAQSSYAYMSGALADLVIEATYTR